MILTDPDRSHSHSSDNYVCYRLPVNKFLAVEVCHRRAELVAVEHQFHVAKTTMIAMKKLTQLTATRERVKQTKLDAV